MVLTISPPEANLSTTQSSDVVSNVISDVIKDGENRVALTGISWIAKIRHQISLWKWILLIPTLIKISFMRVWVCLSFGVITVRN